MKIKLKRTLKQLLGGVLGKRYFQSFFESLLQLSLYGMNIGYQPDADKSGEIPLLKYIKKGRQQTNAEIEDSACDHLIRKNKAIR